ncbi:methyltransferase domain-containing protein [Nocardioides currus]|uniref:SAM-dependent methyltransferase n=1 Tax=Nocardioides currus TaxID=2133958 RepID=A0A2R7YYQ4_9ACTN|nr:methyltransferase domain-containing protein [Nocardioides currus]PUA81481.1 SAM-dependent methyltransferase [Nocardioides currus]
MAQMQESDYGAGRDYAYGSPHLTHARLTARIEEQLHDLVAGLLDRHDRCRVVEVGAGHGTFTAALLAAGATVTVTEMSGPSAEVLRERFADDPRIRVVHDPDGTAATELVAAGCEALVYVSVLHHIPDYLGAVGELVAVMPAGSAFYSTMDPTWYPARSRVTHATEQASYLAWRIAQGNLRRGLATRWRRLRHGFVETEASDMVEFHTVRDGVDQHALVGLLEEHFADAELDEYWSTQSRLLQRLGERTSMRCTFGITARHHR